jgi:hypothetical protein
MEKWNESKEWKEILDLHKTRKISEVGQMKLMKFYFDHKELTLYDFEVEFRKNNSPFHMFAEDPKLTKFCKGFPPVNQKGELQPYVFVFTTKDLKNCKNEFSEQCFDVEGNLERLKKTGYPKQGDDFENLDQSFKTSIENMSPNDEMIFTHEIVPIKFFEFLKKNPIHFWIVLKKVLWFKVSDEIKKKFEEVPPKEFASKDGLSDILKEYIVGMDWIKK